MKFIKYLSLLGVLAVIALSATKLNFIRMPYGINIDNNSAAITTSAVKQFDYDLTTGSRRSSDIYYLQEFLRSFGFFTYITSTGTYGPATAEAVKKFQIANSIPATGIFNTLTRTLANKIIVAKRIKLAVPPVALKVITTNPITPKTVPTISATSTAKDKIKISNIDRYSTKPNEQSITIRNSIGKDNINITGFKLVNSLGSQYIIPMGHTIPGINPIAEDNIILKPGETAKIIVGQQMSITNFQENICTGYFDEKTDYGRNLSHSCPKPDYMSRISTLPDYCIATFDEISSCRTIDTQKTQNETCLQYSIDHFNYQGCLKDFKNKTGFQKGSWLVWMQRNTAFFRQLHDIVILYDRDGKIVDQYSY